MCVGLDVSSKRRGSRQPVILAADDVRVVLGEPARPQKPVDDAEPLVPVDTPELREPDRQLAVRPDLRLVHEHVEGAVHRLDEVGRVTLVPHLRVHQVRVLLRVPRGVPQLAAREVGRHDGFVAAREVQVAHVVLELLAEDPALRMPDGEARPELLGEGEQVELAPEAAMVALSATRAGGVVVEVPSWPKRSVDPVTSAVPRRRASTRALHRLNAAVPPVDGVGPRHSPPSVVAVDRDRSPPGPPLLERLDDLAVYGWSESSRPPRAGSPGERTAGRPRRSELRSSTLARSLSRPAGAEG